MYVDQHRLRQLTSILASVHKGQLSSSAPVVVMFTAEELRRVKSSEDSFGSNPLACPFLYMNAICERLPVRAERTWINFQREMISSI